MTYQAHLYDIVTPASVQGDVEWYRQLALASDGPVLELGAGTGRITLPILEAGCSVTALDQSEAMLAVLRSKLATAGDDVRSRASVVQGDMRAFALPGRFGLIVAPFRAFQHNTTEADQAACLERVRQHLQPGGRFAFNIFHPSLEYMSRHAGSLAGVWRWTRTGELPAGGFVVLSESTRYDTVRRLVHALHRYDQFDAGGILRESSVLRLTLGYLYPNDVRRLLEQAGFKDIAIAGDFTGREFSRDGDELVVVAS